MDKKNLLIVEDDQDAIQFIYRAILAKMRQQFDVFICMDGMEALECMGKRPIDLVVLDLYMNSLYGIEVCQWMAQRNLLDKNKVIISSGYLDESMVMQLQNLGVEHFLKKPYPMETLLDKIKTLITAQDHSSVV